MLTLGLVQASACKDISINLSVIERFAAQAADAGCEALCFPECFLTGYFPKEAHSLALPADSLVLSALSETAASLSIDILAGFMERTPEGQFFITHGLFRRDRTRELYRKTHLGQREQQIFTPGNALRIFPLTGGCRVGIQLCVEAHYPEISQTLALMGAEVILMPHAVPRVAGDRKQLWAKYIPARSYDNRVFTACCNLWDRECFGGGCIVTDPQGEIVDTCFVDGPALLICRLDLDQVAAYRRSDEKPVKGFHLPGRRKALYL